MSNIIFMAFSPRNIIGCFLKKKAYKGGITGTPGPPSLRPRLRYSGEGLPGVLGNKGTLAKYRREQGNIRED